MAGPKGSGRVISAFSANGQYILASTINNKIRQFCVLEAATGKQLKTVTVSIEVLMSAAISNDGGTIYVHGAPRTAFFREPRINTTPVTKIDVATGTQEPFVATSTFFTNLRLSPDGSRLYGTCTDFALVVWDAKTGQTLHAWKNLFEAPYDIELAPNGKSGVMVMKDGPIALNLENFREGVKLPDGANSMRLIGDGTRAATVHKDITLKIWDLKTGNLIKSVELADRDSAKKFEVAMVSPDGKYLYISGNHDGNDLLHLLDIETGKIVLRYQFTNPREDITASPMGNSIILRSLDELRVVEFPLPKR
jgi:DNA-binding beta-propeller fold protein YncE